MRHKESTPIARHVETRGASHVQVRLYPQLTNHSRCLRLLVTDYRMRQVGPLQRRELFGAQLDLDRLKQLLEMLGFGRADNRRGHTGGLQNPGAGDLRGGYTALVCDFRRSFRDRDFIFPPGQAPGELICLRPFGHQTSMMGEKATRQRTPWNYPHALIDTERNHFALFFPIDQIVVVLHRGESVPSVLLRGEKSLGELPCRHARRSEITNLAGTYQRIERIQCFFEWCRVVPSMYLVQIDVIGSQAAQRILAGLDQMLAAQSAPIRPGT